MRKIYLIISLIVLVIVGCSSNTTYNSENNPISINNDKSNELTAIPESQILSFLQASLKKFAEISDESVKLIESFSAQKISKEEFCLQLNEELDNAIKLKEQVTNKDISTNWLNEDLFLMKKFKELKSAVEGAGNSDIINLQNALKFCHGGSIAQLTNIKKNMNVFSVEYKLYFEKGVRSKPEFVNGLEITAVLFDETKNTVLKGQVKKSQNVKYGVGDTISKNNIKVTLNSVKKNYIHPEWSYVKNDREWTDKEWNNHITDYIFAWSSERDSNLKQQIATELNQKYGSRVKENLIYQYFEYSFQNLPSDLSRRFNEGDISAILYIYGTEETYQEKYSLNYGYIHGLFNIPKKYTNNKTKLVISFDNCAFTMKEIEALEKNPDSCPQTFVFDVDLAQVSDWKNY